MKTLEAMREEYQSFMELKKNNPEVAGELVLFNQQVLTKAGMVHEMCLRHWDTGGREEYEKFIEETFAGAYYHDWRMNRAVSVADMMGVCSRLGVNWKVSEIIGETFYAGIPPVTSEEVAMAAREMKTYEHDKVVDRLQVGGGIKVIDGALVWMEKIGIDGKLHPVDSQGEFRELTNENDIYGDGTMVHISDLRALTPEDDVPDMPCTECKEVHGDGTACKDCKWYDDWCKENL